MSFPANTFLIGAQKCGTTYLASLLDQSRDVCVSDPKEPHYLSHRFDRGPAYYEGCFANPEAPVRLDASTTYTVLRPRRDMDVTDAPGILDPVPERIAECAPGARLIYIMRDPVKRAGSAYKHLLRKDAPPQGAVSLVQCLEENPMLALTGRYADQIERYLEVFALSDFLFLDFADLIREPAAVVQKTCDFLGISAEGIAPERTGTEKNSAYQTTAAGQLLKKSARVLPGIRRAGRAVLPRGAQKLLIDNVLRKPSEVRFTDEAEAAALFAEDRARVFELTGMRI